MDQCHFNHSLYPTPCICYLLGWAGNVAGYPSFPMRKYRLCEREQEVGEANLEGVVQCINPALRASHLVRPGGADPGRSRQGSSCMAAYDFMAGQAGGLWAGGHLARP